MQKNPDISIIIVSYNSQNHLKGLLDSIKKSPDKLNKEVILVDNASSDKSASIALKHSLKPQVIRITQNKGFSHGVNIGLKAATGEYIFLLNPDTRIVGGCMQYLYDFAQKTKPLGAVAPQLFNPNGKPQASVFKFPSIFNSLKFYFLGCKNCYGKYLPKKDGVVDVAVMAAFMLPSTVIKKIGNLDEKFFLYYEDIEYCRRLKKAKLPVYYHSRAKIKHAHGASGNFQSHTNSPLLKSAKTYHGNSYFFILNLSLIIGQKWQKLIKKIFSRK